MQQSVHCWVCDRPSIDPSHLTSNRCLRHELWITPLTRNLKCTRPRPPKTTPSPPPHKFRCLSRLLKAAGDTLLHRHTGSFLFHVRWTDIPNRSESIRTKSTSCLPSFLGVLDGLSTWYGTGKTCIARSTGVSGFLKTHNDVLD